MGILGFILCYPRALAYAFEFRRHFWKRLPPRFKKAYTFTLILLVGGTLLAGLLQAIILGLSHPP